MIERLEPPFLDLHAATWTAADRYEIRRDARRFENWESYVAGRLGLGAAADYAPAIGMKTIEVDIRAKAAMLRETLAAVPGVKVPRPRRKSRQHRHLHQGRPRRRGYQDRAVEGEDQRLRLRRVFNAARHDGQEAQGTRPRLPVHYYNTPAEVKTLAKTLRNDIG